MSERKRKPRPLSKSEQLALLKQPNPKVPTGLRNLNIINLLLKTGMRASEVIGLKVDDLQLEEARVYIEESGGARGRSLALAASDLALLESWLQVRPAHSTYLFCTLKGNKLSDRYLREMVKRLAKNAAISHDVYPHLLRYTFAMEFISEVKDLKLLQAALGHREPAATQNYIRLFFENELPLKPSSEEDIKRSGLPVYDERQETLLFQGYPEKKVSAPAAKVVVDADPETTAKSAAVESKSSNGQDETQREETRKGRREAASLPLEPSQKDSRKALSGEPLSAKFTDEIKDKKAIRPVITVQPASKDRYAKIPIPAIRCSNCSYIMRYQADCPSCGTPFSETLRHWRKNF